MWDDVHVCWYIMVVNVINEYEVNYIGQVEHCFTHVKTSSLLTGLQVLLTGLFMPVGTDCSWLDERTDLNNVVGTIMINQQRCSYMIGHVVMK